MKFGTIHRVMTDALAALGLLSLIVSGELHRWLSVALALGMLAAVFLPARWQDNRYVQRAFQLSSVLLLVVQAARALTGADLIRVAIEFAAALQVIRLATRRGAQHDHQIILLALLHLVAGTVLGTGLAYGLCFLGFLIVAPGALVLSHLRREVEGNFRQGARDRTGLPVDVPRILKSRRVISRRFLLITCSLSVPIFAFTALLFVFFPRVGLSLLLLDRRNTAHMIGFSDTVDLGRVGKLRSDPTVVMRVQIPDLPEPPPERVALYLRGATFDHYDGRTWRRTQAGRQPLQLLGDELLLAAYDSRHQTRMLIELEHIEPTVVFLPLNTVGLVLLPRPGILALNRPSFALGSGGELSYLGGDEQGLRYAAIQSHPLGVRGLPSDERARYLRLPPALPARIAALARAWSAGSHNAYESAARIETRLREGYRYDLASPSGGAANPLDHFLFESRAGHCEFYSTAMVVLLRTLGVPARNVTGFAGGTFNRFGRFYTVRQGDAHSWVEVWLGGFGWKRFDPTPPSGSQPRAELEGAMAFLRDLVEATSQRWNRHVVGYDLEQQISLLHRVQRALRPVRDGGAGLGGPARWLALLATGLGLLGWVGYRLRRARLPRGGPRGASPAEASLLAVVALYRSLDQAMAQRGIARYPSTPPLAHARGLVAIDHPLASEVLELTRLYLEVRFGGRPLTDHERLEYARRVRALRRVPLPRPTPRAA